MESLSKKQSLTPHELQAIINWWNRKGNFNLEHYLRIIYSRTILK